MRGGGSLQCISQQGAKVARKCIRKYGRTLDEASITETGRSTRVIAIDQSDSTAMLLQLERERDLALFELPSRPMLHQKLLGIQMLLFLEF